MKLKAKKRVLGRSWKGILFFSLVLKRWNIVWIELIDIQKYSSTNDHGIYRVRDGLEKGVKDWQQIYVNQIQEIQCYWNCIRIVA